MRTHQTQAGDGERRGILARLGRLVPFARSTVGGKKTVDIKFRCADELKDELARQANALGFRSASELGETVMSLALFGFDHVATVQRDRLEKVAKLFPDGTVRVKGKGAHAAR